MLLPIKDSVVHSTAILAQVHPPSQRYVTTETVRAPMLVNVKDISAGEEIIVHVPQEEALAEKPPERDVRGQQARADMARSTRETRLASAETH